MKAVVFSGTTEGRVFSRQLAALGAEVLVSVATPLGAEEQGKADGITVHCGRLTPEEMAALLQGAALCVDATHPYAVDATKNIRTVKVYLIIVLPVIFARNKTFFLIRIGGHKSGSY